MTHYDILGVATNATAAEIKTAYKRLVRRTHSDHQGDDKAMRAVVEANRVLSDPRLRAAYDAELAQARGRPTLREHLDVARGVGAEVVGAVDEVLNLFEQARATTRRVVGRVGELWQSLKRS